MSSELTTAPASVVLIEVLPLAAGANLPGMLKLRDPTPRSGNPISVILSTRRVRRVEHLVTGRTRPACYSPNTYSIDADEVFLSSGAFGMTEFGCFEPTSTAMYCLPLIAKLIGGALMPVPALKLQSSFSVLAS